MDCNFTIDVRPPLYKKTVKSLEFNYHTKLLERTLTVLNSISHSNRYLPHENLTRFHAVKLYRTGVWVSFVCRRYHISKASLMCYTNT